MTGKYLHGGRTVETALINADKPHLEFDNLLPQ
jgi:hypothetical protein